MSLWSCTACTKSFARKGDLTRHKSIHTGIKPHICETCGKGFSQRSGLKTHRNVHSKERPYICGIGTCKKAFGDPSSRTRHRRETHMREGAYKCIIDDCGTKIKRRSAFATHLRKHGLDPSSLDLDAISSRSKGVILTPEHFCRSEENKSYRQPESRCTSPSYFDEGPGYHLSESTDGGEAGHFVDKGGWSSGETFDRRWISTAGSPPGIDASLPGPMFDETINLDSSCLPHDIYTYMSDNLGNAFNTFSTSLDYSLLVASPSHLPVLELFSEAGSDGSQSLWSSPSSTHSTPYTTDYDDNTIPLSLANNISQEPLLYNFM